jgi:hypothetical protein
MKVPSDEGLATHIGPESCVDVGNRGCEALTGRGAGQVLSREILTQLQGADAVDGGGRQYRAHRQREMRTDPAWSETLCMHPSTSCGSREVPRLTREIDGALARIGNPEGAIR